jgi:hypothetical protein
LIEANKRNKVRPKIDPDRCKCAVYIELNHINSKNNTGNFPLTVR